ncbi:12195_t:CDS:2, partial [Gigaspora margarita]
MVRISIEKRSRVYALVQEGFPSCYVAKKEGLSQSSVVRISQKAEKTGSVKDLPKSGYLRFFTERDERTVVRLIAISENTVKRILRRNGLSAQ